MTPQPKLLTSGKTSRVLTIHSADLPPLDFIFGRSPAMEDVRQRVERIGGTSVPVLIVGETGTGKEVVARAIHNMSPRAEQPFVRVDCAGAPSDVIDAEIFGRESHGAGGASVQGLIDRAQRGTLFVESVTALAPHVQAKLFHVLRDGMFVRIGGWNNVNADFRVICSSTCSLAHEVAAGRFDESLYYFIDVATLELPPLRARRADIPSIAAYFHEHYSRHYGYPGSVLSQHAIDVLLQYEWRGNIRELENCIERYVLLGSAGMRLEEILPTYGGFSHFGEEGLSLKARMRSAVREIERQVILDVLRANHWNRKETARALKISYRSLFHKLNAAGLPRKRAHVQRSAALDVSAVGTAGEPYQSKPD